MPTIPSIKTSVENKDVLVMDEHAKQGTFKRDARGRLMSYAGGFSVVFPYQIENGEKWAFRCWHADVNNTQKRYETIAHAITDAYLDFLCDFEYVEKGINVEGKIFPTTRMRWVDGISLKDYICKHRDSKEKLRRLADNFLQMTRALHEKSLAHGDLQHGNILVSDDDKLHLVDYDSFYCPKLKGEMDTVTGLPDYQHPSRATNKTVSEKLDYFSELVIYLSILALANDATLIDKYQVEGSERLLFAKEDFENLHASQIYHDISSLGDECKELLGILDEYLSHKDINELRPFTDYLLSNKVSFSTTALKVKRNIQQVTVKWDVPFKAKVKLKQAGEVIPKEFKVRGQYSTTLNDISDFCLIVETKDGQLIEKKIRIEVFDESVIDFSADKKYVYPKIPIYLSWDVKHAKQVWLGGEEVSHSGFKTVTQNEATTYILRVKDEFGTKEESVYVGMLPIPRIDPLLVPTPNIEKTVNVSVAPMNINIPNLIPQINIMGVDISVPHVPDMKEFGVDVCIPYVSDMKELGIGEILKELPIMKTCFSVWHEMKSLFSYYFKKRKQDGR